MRFDRRKSDEQIISLSCKIHSPFKFIEITVYKQKLTNLLLWDIYSQIISEVILEIEKEIHTHWFGHSRKFYSCIDLFENFE